MSQDEADRLLVQRIRDRDESAWEELIARYEGRLIAFVDSRLRDRAAAEDVVQETFTGFLLSLPNYDERTRLETWLFSIAAHKLTDVLRREGRRPTIPLFPDTGEESSTSEPPGRARPASSLLRSHERRSTEAAVLGGCLQELVDRWKERGEWERLMCTELLFVLGWRNKDVAARLDISEQAVANHKQYVVGKLEEAAARARLTDFDPHTL